MLTITSAKIRFACFFAIVAFASTSASAQLVSSAMDAKDMGTTSLFSANKFMSLSDAKPTSSVFSVRASLFSNDVISSVPATATKVSSPVVDSLDITGVGFADIQAIKNLPLVTPRKRFKFSSL